jgi:hypothetical protein
MPVKRQKGLKGKADALFSQIIRSHGECEAEGYAGRNCSNQLQTAHIVTRGRSATRTDLRNAFCLCFAHHRFFTDYPREFSRFITGSWAQQHYDAVYAKSVTPTKVNWQARVDFLMKVLNGEISVGEARVLENE